MMEANEINPNVSEAELTATDDDKEDNSVCAQIPKVEKTFKGLTMEVGGHLSVENIFHFCYSLRTFSG